ncbi:MAG: autotransporter assembly complex family protein [Pseudomonadota bacterium]
MAVALATGPAFAQGIAYSVKIDAPRPLAQLLQDNLDLLRWRGNPRLDLDQLQRLVKLAPEQARTLIATEGYYAPKVAAGLDTSGPEPLARIIVDAGEPVLVGEVELVLTGFASDAPLRKGWSLPVGKVFRQADWEAAKRKLLRQAMLTRYPRAHLVESSATVDPEVRRALLHVAVDAGPEVHFGALKIEGARRYRPAIVENLHQIKPGDDYSETALQAFQGRLQDTGYYSGVEVSADLSGVALDETQAVTVPVLVRLTENKYRNVSAGLGYSTNTGNRAQLSYDDLSVFGLRMKSAITLETRKQAAHADFYYPTTTAGYNDSVGTKFERTDLNGEVTSVASIAAKRAWGTPLLERSVTLEFLTEQKAVAGELSSSSKSLPLTYSLTKRHLDSLLFPADGYVLNAQLGGALLPILTDRPFVRASGKFIAYRPLSSTATLILRGEAGALASRAKDGVPGTYLFRAGGDQSVRGYGFQQLGVQEGAAIVGGRYLLAASAEYDYWFKPAWGAAVFYDAGNAGDIFKDLKPKSGYGVGARWRSPVGPINIDAAYGHAIRKYRIHFSLGFTF